MPLFIDADVLLRNAASKLQVVSWWDDSTVTASLNVRAAADVVDYMVRDIVGPYVGNVQLFIGSGKSDNFRRGLWPAYKQHRKLCDVPVGLGHLREYILKHGGSNYHYVNVAAVGLEADDTLGMHITSPIYNYNEIATGVPTVLWSEDKDMMQIPGHHLVDGALVYQSVEAADRFHMLQTLMGDATDGYPGAKGIGPVKAEKILAEAEAEGIPYWQAVVAAYNKAGLTEDDALVQARVARILRWNEKPGEWTPPNVA